MLAPSGTSYEQLHRNVRLEVDNKPVELPDLEGIIVLNILRYGVYPMIGHLRHLLLCN